MKDHLIRGLFTKLQAGLRKRKKESVQHPEACDIPELLHARAEGPKSGSRYSTAGGSCRQKGHPDTCQRGSSQCAARRGGDAEGAIRL